MKFDQNWIFQDHFLQITHKQKKSLVFLRKAFIKVESLRLFHWSKFQQSLSLVENGKLLKRIPNRFWSKSKKFSTLEHRNKAGIWHISRNENYKSVDYHRTPAVRCAELVAKTFFLRMAISEIKYQLSSKMLDRSVQKTAVKNARFFLEKWKLNKGESSAIRFSENAKFFSVPLHSIESNNQQAEIKIDCRHLAKFFRKSILQKVFSNEWIYKSCGLRENGQFPKSFLITLVKETKIFVLLKKAIKLSFDTTRKKRALNPVVKTSGH